MTSPTWRKSSRSTQGTSGECVEVMRLDGVASEQGGPDGPALRT
jgi:Domain of unknown function (DUF397)